MTDHRPLRVAGSGIFGLSAALAIQRRGLPVQVLDPAPAAVSASAVAAGLLAPVGEALFDPLAAPHYPILVAAMDRWVAFAAEFSIALRRDAFLASLSYTEAAVRLGAKIELGGDRVRIAGDAVVIHPPAVLEALADKFLAGGGVIAPRAIYADEGADGSPIVLAVGPGAARLSTLAPELACLAPVKGQIAVLPHGPQDGRVVRWAGGYMAPQPGGARVGATMEVGTTDTAVEPSVIKALIDAARGHVPGLDAAGAYGEAGVRMQSPDGLPLVGPSQTPGVFLAVGARRNGWLLAPLVAEMIAAYVVGEDPGPWAAMLHPARFG
jgi:glycine oxidase